MQQINGRLYISRPDIGLLHSSVECSFYRAKVRVARSRIAVPKQVPSFNLCPGNGGGVFLPPQHSFSRKSPTRQWIKTVSFRGIVTDPFGFLTPLSVSLYLLPVLRGRSASDVHETGFPTIQQWTSVKQRYKFIDVMFLECQRWKMVRRLCRRNINNVICTFSRWRTKPEVVIGLHLEPIIVAHDRINLKYL